MPAADRCPLNTPVRAMNTRPAAVHKGSASGRRRKWPVGALNLVTVAQRSYSCALLAVYGAKFAGRCLLKGTARPPAALGHTV
jgi:hypothetical protein